MWQMLAGSAIEGMTSGGTAPGIATSTSSASSGTGPVNVVFPEWNPRRLDPWMIGILAAAGLAAVVIYKKRSK